MTCFSLAPFIFRSELAKSSRRSKSRIVLALDLDLDDSSNLVRKAKEVVTETSDYICAVKLNFHLIVPLGLSELKSVLEQISSFDLPTIADLKLNDIDNTNRIATDYLWKAGFSAVIVNPFAGYEGGLDIVFAKARELGKGVLTLAYMSHKGASESYGLTLREGKTIFELFLDRAMEWSADGVIVGASWPEKIAFARARLDDNVMIFSPGSGAQGGSAIQSLEAGCDYLIVGRSIVGGKNPKEEARRLFDTLASWTETHQPLAI